MRTFHTVGGITGGVIVTREIAFVQVPRKRYANPCWWFDVTLREGQCLTFWYNEEHEAQAEYKTLIGVLTE